eukprot:scaffold10488_cov121-Isochrysis_galbana.AAC.4
MTDDKRRRDCEALRGIRGVMGKVKGWESLSHHELLELVSNWARLGRRNAARTHTRVRRSLGIRRHLTSSPARARTAQQCATLAQ